MIKIRKYRDYKPSGESFDKSIYEDFSDKGIVDELKEFTKLIKSDILDNSIHSKIYNFDDLKFKIEIKKTDRNYSRLPIGTIIDHFFYNEKIDLLNIYLEHTTDDIDYITSIIIHEIRHIYDIYYIMDESELTDFKKGGILSNIIKDCRDTNFIQFLHLIYSSLLHELVARNNQVFPYIFDKKISRDEAFEMMKETFVYKSLEDLENFNSEIFINKFNKQELDILTQKFKNNFDDNDNLSINEYYKKWETYYKNISKEWFDEMEKEINILYESYKETTNLDNILMDMYKKVFNK